MSTQTQRIRITGREVLVVLVAMAVVVAWLLAFFLPQSHKLVGLDAQRSSLQTIVTADQARLQRLKDEAAHVNQIKTIDDRLQGYVPSTEELYTYIHTISAAAKSAGVTITSLNPSSSEAVSGVPYLAIPVTASIRGSYDHLLAFLKNLYHLPRLTDINDIYISGGGPGTNRSSKLSVSLQLTIFTSQSSGAGT